MTKEQAIQWHEAKFCLGMEYGVLHALITIYDITLEDLGWSNT